MAAPTISIIIPVYNAAAYIEQCIHSVLNQSLQDIEIIAVNDGSTDKSPALLDAIAATDDRLRVFHRSNQGVSAARNFGLQEAKGIYIAFSDSDDWMEATILEELYKAITIQGCDWAFCNVNLIQEGQSATVRLQLTEQVLEVADDRGGMLHRLMRFHFDYANWNKLFAANIIREHQIRFNEEMSIWEDLLFNLQYLHYSKRVALIAKPLYNYRILSTSLYSGQTKDRLPQFNLLYRHYLQPLSSHSVAEREAFKQEMARLTYNHLLYDAELRVRSKTKQFFSVWRGYLIELKRFDPAVFYYPAIERRGLQGIKKSLLENKRFNLFALVIASKPYLKKPAKFILRLLKK